MTSEILEIVDSGWSYQVRVMDYEAGREGRFGVPDEPGLLEFRVLEVKNLGGGEFGSILSDSELDDAVWVECAKRGGVKS